MQVRIKNILLVENNIDDQHFFVNAVSKISRVNLYYIATNGEEALNWLNSNSRLPDIIFMDINMPVMDGWQCLFEIKSDKALKHIPVIIYSTFFTHDEVEKAVAQGALYFFNKPYCYHELTRKLSKIVNHIYAGTHQGLQLANSKYDSA